MADDDDDDDSDNKQWASLADRLNPNRAAFDPHLKANWKTMSKKERKRIISDDKKAIHALKTRGTAQPLPFPADPDDHCETSPIAYTHIVPLLNFIAKRLGKKQPSDLEIYDPYYCAGGMVRHLNKLGYPHVYNRREDFYQVIAAGNVPSHDVIVTNPPYSGNHFDKLLAFLAENNKPALLLLPAHFSKKNKSSLYKPDQFCFLNSPERYHYWTPEGMRPDDDGTKKKRKNKKQHRNLVLGTRNSPFASHWFVAMEPLVTNDEFISAVNEGEVEIVEGCRIHEKQQDVLPTSFKGTVAEPPQNNNAEDTISDGKKRKRRRKNKTTGEVNPR